jgi:hypothetical protein
MADHFRRFSGLVQQVKALGHGKAVIFFVPKSRQLNHAGV